MKGKGFAHVLVILGIVAVLGIAGYFIIKSRIDTLSVPVIEYILPEEAPIDARISISGSGFTPDENSLQFGQGFAYLNNLTSLDGKTITFVLPESFDTCNPDGSTCAEFLSRPIPGQAYEVSVINENGRSNLVNFAVTLEDDDGEKPTPTPIPTPKPKPTPTTTPVPTPKPEEEEISLKEGERDSSFLLQKIYPDYVIGLNFWEYPIAIDQGHPVTLQIGESASNGCTVTLTLTRIEGDIATFVKETDFNRLCPTCLAGDTLIETPNGAILVQELREGVSVWTTNESGERVSSTITEIGKTRAPFNHHVIHVTLDDGRELFVSPGHGTSEGRAIGDMRAGEFLDGSRITNIKKIPYTKEYTYDILPAGETGFYWANGILMGSTLR